MSTESNGSNDEILITRVPTVRREPLTRYEGRYAEPIAETSGELEKLWQLTWWERTTLAFDDIAFKTRLIMAITPYLFTITKGLVMKNWKTTISAVVGAIAYVLNAVLGLEIPSEAIIATVVFFIGFFAKDSNVTGGTTQQ
jgi:hypothetical protein